MSDAKIYKPVTRRLIEVFGDRPKAAVLFGPRARHVNIIAITPDQVAANLTPLLLDIRVDGVCLYGAEYFEKFRRKALNASKKSRLTRKYMGRDWHWHFEKIPKKEGELTWEEFREL